MRARADLSAAIDAWTTALGRDAVLTEPSRIAEFTADTTPLRRRVPVVLFPADEAAVTDLVRIASRHRTPIYPVSTGRNWGYGTANPPTDDCALVVLSRLNRIIAFDADSGVISLEPGVTQGQLHAWLTQHRLRFLVPVTGAGPNTSLVGNALERGYGITPHADHFGALMSLRAVLPDGSLYCGNLTGLGGEAVDNAFKWGMGPYLDGLFAQGAFGIVTQAAIVLAPTPPSTLAYFFSVARPEQLGAAVEGVKGVLNAIGSIGGSINLMNARRVLAMTAPYPGDAASGGSIMSDSLVAAQARRLQIAPWTGVGALYGEPLMVKAAQKIVRRELKGKVSRLLFVSAPAIRRAKAVSARLPGGGGRFGTVVDKLDKTLRLMSGQPSDIALPLAYWMSGQMQPGQSPDPARDGCGLIWYPPLVPMSAARVEAFVRMVGKVCTQHAIEPLITLTSVSPRCFDSTVPILFDRDKPDAAARADACFRDLFETGRRDGFLPYRMGAQHMELVTSVDNAFWPLVQQLKRAIDPNFILAPGRYCQPPDR